MKTAAHKKASSGERPCAKATPRSTTNIENLKTQLNLIIQPDYELGDYYPRLDRRLCGLLPDLVAQALDALEARYPGDNTTGGEHHARSD